MYFSSGFSQEAEQGGWSEESQSRVSFPPENGFPSESSFCRTMRPLGPHHHNRRTNSRLSTQKRSTISSSSTSYSSSFNPSIKSQISHQSDNMFDKSIENLFGTSATSGESCSHSNYYIKLTSSSPAPSPTEESSPSSTRSSHHHRSSHISHPNHWASFTMILISVIILSTFSTSSMVMCVPLKGNNGHHGGVGGMEETQAPASTSQGLMISPSKMLEIHQKLQQNNRQQHQSQAEMYLPSLMAGMVGGGASSPSSSSPNQIGVAAAPEQTRNLHSQQQPPIQKRHKDIARSIIMENPNDVDDEDDVIDDDQEDSSEMNNQIERMVGPPPPPPSLMGLGSIALGGNGGSNSRGVGGSGGSGDDEPTSSGDLMDQSGGNGGKGGGGNGGEQWETVIDPHLYVLTEWGTNPFKRMQLGQTQQQQFSMFRQQRKRRNSGTGPSLSIVNPLDVLRQRLLLEIARRRMRQSQNQIIANEEILRKIGRR